MLARFLLGAAGDEGGSYLVNDLVDKGDGRVLSVVIVKFDPDEVAQHR